MSFVQPGDRIAVTGATGFVGQALVEHLARCGYQVVGISERPKAPASIRTLLADYYCINLTQAWPRVGPFQGLVHLAGLASVGPSFEHPHDYINTNSVMVTHMLESLLRDGWQGRAIIVSSGAIYGGVGEVKGFTEESSPQVTSPYVVSKLLVENQTEYYRRRGLDALAVRPFNHIGPRQRGGFIVPDLAMKVARWQPGTAMPVGNLDSARDYTDVRDIVCAYRTLLELREPANTTYNVCSGAARSGWEILKAICAALGMRFPPTLNTDQRVIDPSGIVGNADRLRSETGWEPTIQLQKSIDDFVASG